MSTEKKTALYETHVSLGAQMVPFAGYLMPVQYPAGMQEEHRYVREKAGLFDVSHMGEFFLKGPSAREDLERILTNRYMNLKPGRVRYSPMCNEKGGTVDDLIVYCLEEDSFMIVVNASNRDKDREHLLRYLSKENHFEDRSDEIGLLALQGPLSLEIMKRLVSEELLPQKYYSFKDHVMIEGIDCLVSRTGYTGEFGYEIYHPASESTKLWSALLAVAKEDELLPAGLGARDTLRLEAGMPLYGHEMNDEITPLEAALDFGVKMDKEDFIGKSGIEAKLPLSRVRVGLKVRGRGIVREHMPILDAETGEVIGETTSGTFSPSLQVGIAMGLVPPKYSEIGTTLPVEVRGRKLEVEVVNVPFIQKD